MANETNLKYYALCRSELNINSEQIYAEVSELFSSTTQTTHVTREQIAEWSRDYQNTKGKIARRLMLHFDDTCSDYDNLDFKLNHSPDGANRTIKSVQFYALCRYQMGQTPKAIQSELAGLFCRKAPDLGTLNKWILNFCKEDLPVKSLDTTTTSMSSEDSRILSLTRLRPLNNKKRHYSKRVVKKTLKQYDTPRRLLNEQQNEIVLLKSLNESLKIEIKNAKNRIFTLEDNLATLAKYYDEAGFEMPSVSKPSSVEYEEKIRSLTQQIKRLQDEIMHSAQPMRQEDTALCGRIIDLERDLIEQCEINKELTTRMSSLQSELDHTRQNTAANLTDVDINVNLDEFLSVKCQCAHQLALLKEDHDLEIADLNERIRMYIIERNNYRYKCESLERECSCLKESQQEMLNEANVYFEEIKLAVEEHNRERKQLVEMKLQIEQLGSELDTARLELASKKAANLKLNERLEAKEAHVEYLVERHKQAREDYEEDYYILERKYARLQDDYYILKAILKESKVKLEELEFRNEKLREKNKCYLDDLNEYKNESSLLRAQNKLLQSENKKERSSNKRKLDQTYEDVNNLSDTNESNLSKKINHV